MRYFKPIVLKSLNQAFFHISELRDNRGVHLVVFLFGPPLALEPRHTATERLSREDVLLITVAHHEHLLRLQSEGIHTEGEDARVGLGKLHLM